MSVSINPKKLSLDHQKYPIHLVDMLFSNQLQSTYRLIYDISPTVLSIDLYIHPNR